MARILIIEDDTQMRSMLKQCLERSGHEVREASSGYEGLEVVKSHTCELIVTDVLVPNGGKFDLIEWLRQASPEVKIMAISGGGQSEGMDVLEAAESVGRIGRSRSRLADKNSESWWQRYWKSTNHNCCVLFCPRPSKVSDSVFL